MVHEGRRHVEGYWSLPERLCAAWGVSDRALALQQVTERVRAVPRVAVGPSTRSASALSAQASAPVPHGGVPREADAAAHGLVGPARVHGGGAQ
jgi:hypothetical protein